MALFSFSKKSLVLFILLIFIGLLILVGLWWYFIEFPKFGISIKSARSIKPQAYLTFNLSLEQNLKKAFADPKYSSITTYLSLGSAENKDLTLKFDYFSRAYQKMLVVYSQTKDQKMKEQISLFHSYLKSYPQFKDKDFPLPN